MTPISKVPQWLMAGALLLAAGCCADSSQEGLVYDPASRKYVQAPPIPAVEELAKHVAGITSGMLGVADRTAKIHTADQRRLVAEMLKGAKVVRYTPGESGRVWVDIPNPPDSGLHTALIFETGFTLPGDYTLQVPETQYSAGIEALLKDVPLVDKKQ